MLKTVQSRRGKARATSSRPLSAETGYMSTAAPFSLRQESPDDLQALAEMLVAVDRAWGDVPFRVAVREGGIEAARAVISRPKLTSVVAVSDDQVIGYGALRQEPEAVMLVNMLVVPEWQGCGVGRAITVHLCSQVLETGNHVHLDVLLDSVAAHALYRSIGFVEFDVTIGKLSSREGRLMCLVPEGAAACPRRRVF